MKALESLDLLEYSKTVWRFFALLVVEFIAKNCQKSAAALTYMTLFALVPTMTVVYSMFSLIPAFEGVGDQLNAMIFSNFVPETGQEVQRYLLNFSEQARNLTGPGVAVLVVTAFLMLRNIEKTFNTIWGVEQARRGLQSFLIYWAVLSIGPFLLGAGLLMSTYLLSMKFVVADMDIMAAMAPLFRIVPIFLASAAFTLLFAAVPNCRVPIKLAAFGGLVTALCFELAKVAFAAFIANSSFKLVYGAFAVVPIFLIWVNFLWMIILIGAIFVRTLAEKDYSRASEKLNDFFAVLSVLEVFKRKAHQGYPVKDSDCVRAGLGLVHWQQLRSLLVKSRWLTVTESGDYALVRNLEHLTLWDLANLVGLRIDKAQQAVSLESSWAGEVQALCQELDDFAQSKMSRSLASLYTSEKSDRKDSSEN